MDVHFCAPQDFQFRQMKKIRVFESSADLPKVRSCLLAISNKYGLTFVGKDEMLKVFWTSDVIAAGRLEGNPNDTGMNAHVNAAPLHCD